MNIGMYKSASALAACERWQEVIAQNIASASVPGFKKTDATFESYAADRERFGEGRSQKEARGVMPISVSQMSPQQGEMRTTNGETDFAVQGRGFFQVQRPDGSTGYTRDGEFHLNAERVLVNKQDMPVLGDGGPINFKPEGGRISITSEGTIVQGSENVGKLPVFDFKRPEKLQRAGDGLLVPPAGEQADGMEKPAIVNGMLEGSNVQPLQEMVSLIAVSRAYEANQRVVTTTDAMMDKAIQNLL